MALYQDKHLLQATCDPQVRVEICNNAILPYILTYSEFVVTLSKISVSFTRLLSKLMVYYNGWLE